MKRIVIAVRIRGGRMFICNRQRFDDALKTWQDCEGVLTLERSHATRSKAQNDYYHAVVVARVAGKFSEELGRDVDPKEAHELLKAQFLPHDLAANGTNGTLMHGLVIGGSTTKLNKLQFIEYLETIVGWAAEKWDLYIPDPDPDWRAQAEGSH